MNLLYEVVSSLNKEEMRHFTLFSERVTEDADRKDLMLLAYMRRSGVKYSDSFIAKKLYGSPTSPAFYRLKNRLLESLGDFLTLHHLWKSDVNELNRYLSLANVFRGKSRPDLALMYLKRAEKKATAVEHFEMLDIVYGNFVKLSNELITVNPESYIDKRKENAEKLNKIRDTDQVLAALTYRLKVTQNVAGDKSTTLNDLDNIIQRFSSDASLKESKSFQVRIYQVISQILLQQHNYEALEGYLVETLQNFEKRKWFDKQNHDTRLQMLTYTVNSLFRNGKHHDSLAYAGKLGEEIKAYNNLLYDKYLFFYYNSLVINYSAIDRKKALQTLEQFEREIKNKRNSYYDQFLYLNKAILLYQLAKPEEAIRNIVKLYVNDNFMNTAPAIKLKIFMAELMMQFDAGDPESYTNRSSTFKTQFKMLLKTKDFDRERRFIKLLDKMVKTPGYKKDKKLKAEAESIIKTEVSAAVMDSEIIRYSLWLGEKWGISEN